MLLVDEEASHRRRADLTAYLSGEVDDGGRLLCESAGACRASIRPGEQFVEGQLSHVGHCYELVDRGRPLRILVVSKQVGGSLDGGSGDRGHEHVTVDSRDRQVDSAKYGPRPHPRTNHMVGTELALKVLLGLPTDGEPTVPTAEGRRIHVFDCMAMANATLCSRAGAGSSGQGSRTMIEHCQRHLAKTMEILEPNVVLAEGWTKSSARGREPSVASTIAATFEMTMPTIDPALTTRAEPWGTVAVITAYHPSRHWFTSEMPYWWRLEPLLKAARSTALDGP